jgi:two-component system chemotaxis sensor kinase CheA
VTDIRAQLLAAFEVEHREHLDAIREAMAEPARADLREVFRRAHSLKGAARAVDLPVIEDLAHRLEDLFARVREGGLELAASVGVVHQILDALEAQAAAARTGETAPDLAPAQAALDRLLARGPIASSPAPEAPAQAAAAAAEDPAGHPERAEFLRVDNAAIGRLTQAMHQVAGDLQVLDAAPGETRALDTEARRLETLWRALRVRATGGREAALVSEFETALRGLTRTADALARRQTRAVWALGQSVQGMRDEVEAIALTPAESVLGDLGRMVRDLARETGVEVDVRITGLQTPAERRVLQALRSPIIQLLRNALSHGAEPATRRQALGKPERLTIGLELAGRGGRLQVRVFDDGAGPDLARLEQSAIAAGRIEARKPGEPPRSPEEILGLAFEPGLSAAASVDRLSGRGMGLSVVAEAARDLGATVRLASRQPWGAEVVLSAPISTSRQSVILAETRDGLYAVPSFGVRRLLRLDVTQLETVNDTPTARIEIDGSDVVVPVAPLNALLSRTGSPIPVTGGFVQALLMARGDRYVAAAVDAVQDVREGLIQRLDATPLDPALVLGALFLSDETPAAVLNPDALVERWLRDERALAAAGIGLAAAADEAATEQVRTVLVVDDSITTRTLEKSILEAQGYRVLLAVDGLDALGVLRSGEAVIDLVVADIEMPRMDGFSLLQAIKADAGLAALPVILMTSREAPEDVRRGMELGAEAYITKQKFDQRELLATIGRVL